MITLQVVPLAGLDAYTLLREKVTHEARTWSWDNRARTRLVHTNSSDGYIEVSGADGVLLAQIHPGEAAPYFFAEKFIGRLVAWFEGQLVAINIQFRSLPPTPRKRRAKKATGTRAKSARKRSTR